MKPLFKEAQIVRDKQFQETHMILKHLSAGGINFYQVRNVSGPGAYEGHEVFEEKDLEPID